MGEIAGKYLLACKDDTPKIGDIILFDNVFENKEHYLIGIIIDVDIERIETAEGNVNNVTALVKRSYSNVRGFVRL